MRGSVNHQQVHESRPARVNVQKRHAEGPFVAGGKSLWTTIEPPRESTVVFRHAHCASSLYHYGAGLSLDHTQELEWLTTSRPVNPGRR